MADQLRASHILIMHVESDRSSASRSKDEALKKVQDIKQSLESGADFGDLARMHSDCPSSAKGGDLGWFNRGAMVPEFDSATAELDVDAQSDIVETAFGYHLIHRTG
jgi:peptidyl-prolyl cis-trans isomerase C